MVNIFYLDYDPKLCAQYYCDKHVNKIMIEILQILSQIHHEIGDLEPPYKKCMAIKSNLGPYLWAMESVSNYKYCINLAKNLLKEFKYRFENNEHKCEKAINWLSENIPKNIKKKNKTKFKFTENIKIYNSYFNEIDAARFSYVDFKCKTDKWTKRNKPIWFDKYLEKSESSKKKLIEKILINVKEKLPEFSKKHKLKTRRFHSFLRICYDNLFNDKWNNKINQYTNMFNPKKALIHQLGYGHLLKVYDISESLFNLNIFHELNNNSLRFRNKLKIDK